MLIAVVETKLKPLDFERNYIALHRIIRSWYTGRWWVACYIWYSEEGPGRAAAPPSPLFAVPNVTAYPSTASVPITVYDGPLLCGFDAKVKIKEVDLYSTFIVVPHTQGAQVRITECYLQITPYLPLSRKHSPDGASPD